MPMGPMLTIQKFGKNIILTDKLSIIVTELFCRKNARIKLLKPDSFTIRGD